MPTVTGKVEAISQNTQGWYSVKINGNFYSAGKYPLKCEKGDTVSMDYTQNGKYFNGDAKSLQVVNNAPAVSNETNNGTTSSKAAVDWDKKDQRITYLACKNTAIAFINAAVTNGSLKLPAKAAYDSFEAAVEMQTTKYFQQAWYGDFSQQEDVTQGYSEFADLED